MVKLLKLLTFFKLSNYFKVGFFLSLIIVSGCQIICKPDYRQKADLLAANACFDKQWIKTQNFHFLSYQKLNGKKTLDLSQAKQKKSRSFSTRSDPTLHIYIEGDGRSYITKTEVSSDPTPHNPIALKLALLDPHPNVIYLARPCQFTPVGQDPSCTQEIWTRQRFSEQVIAAMNEAVGVLVGEQKTPKPKIVFIGFSGGAAIAALLSARRDDVEHLVTVAGDLDHREMTEYHGTTPLPPDALNPKDFTHKLAKVSQFHFAGEEDTIVPPHISANFVAAQQAIAPVPKRYVLKGVDHHNGWELHWKQLLPLLNTHKP